MRPHFLRQVGGQITQTLIIRAVIAAAMMSFCLAQLILPVSTDAERALDQYQSVMQLAVGVLSDAGQHDAGWLGEPQAFVGILLVTPAVICSEVGQALFDLNEGETLGLLRWMLHLTAFSLSLVTLGILFKLIRRVAGDRLSAATGVLFLALYPTWLTQSLLNYQDMGLACFYTLGLYGAVKAYSPRSIAFRQGMAIVAAATIGIAAVTTTAVPIMLVQWTAICIAAFRFGRPGPRLRSVAAGLIVSGLAIYIFTPQAWMDPFGFAAASAEASVDAVRSGCGLVGPPCETMSQQGRWIDFGWPVLLLACVSPLMAYFIIFGRGRPRILVGAALGPILVASVASASLISGLRFSVIVLPAITAVLFAGLALQRRRSAWMFQLALGLTAFGMVIFLADIFRLLIGPYL